MDTGGGPESLLYFILNEPHNRNISWWIETIKISSSGCLKGGDTLVAIAAVIAARNSCTQRNGGLKAAMSAVCWIPACWKLPVTEGSNQCQVANHSLQFACSGWTGMVCSAVAPAQCLDSNWERSRCHSLLWSLLLVYQVHPVSMSACMNCGPQSLLLVYHLLNRRSPENIKPLFRSLEKNKYKIEWINSSTKFK